MTIHKSIASSSLLMILVIGAASAAPVLAAEPLRYQTREALVWVEGTSTLHDWRVESTALDGEVLVPEDFFDDDTASGLVPAGSATLPARSLKSDKRRMDSLMHESLATETHPTIEFGLTDATVDGSPSATEATVRATGRLTVAGVTCDVSVSLRVDRSTPDVMVVSGELPLKMTDFGIDPPRAMLGTLKTGDEVTVGFRWVVAVGGGR